MKSARGDLPRKPQRVFAPSAGAGLAATADDCAAQGAPHVGNDHAGPIARHAHADDLDLKQTAPEAAGVTAAENGVWVDDRRMAMPD